MNLDINVDILRNYNKMKSLKLITGRNKQIKSLQNNYARSELIRKHNLFIKNKRQNSLLHTTILEENNILHPTILEENNVVEPSILEENNIDFKTSNTSSDRYTIIKTGIVLSN
jgi:hypothetical protein